jgi:clan AA aspartic protease (TIGR02281 family)
MRFLLSIAVFFFGLNTIVAQDVVKMEKENGVYKIPCKINGLPLKFIFDTGASNVSISLTEALFMLKNGYLKESDIRGTIYYSIANGEIAEGTKINLQKIEVGKQVLYNVEASIVHTSQAPLLFGQSAMERFGKFTMDYSNANLMIGNATNTTSNTTSAAAIKSVKIGTQTWMSENLNVSTFRNGDPIPEAKSIEEWKNYCNTKEPAFWYLNINPENGKKYGKLYNYYAIADSREIAPFGWHVSTKFDWQKLSAYLGGDEKAGKKIKSTQGWISSDGKSGNGLNIYNFLALAGGAFDGWLNRFLNGGPAKDINDEFKAPCGEGCSTYWWSTTVEYDTKHECNLVQIISLRAYLDDLLFNSSNISIPVFSGYYVRCVKD